MDFVDTKVLNDSCDDCIKELYYNYKRQNRIDYLERLLKEEEIKIAKEIMKIAPMRYEIWCDCYIRYMEEWDLIQREDGVLQPIPRALDTLPIDKKIKLGNYYIVDEALNDTSKYAKETQVTIDKMKEELLIAIKEKGTV